MKIVIGNDHAAVELKNELMSYLKRKGYDVINVGTDVEDSCDYPDYGLAAAKKVISGEAERGILICGTGIGISLAANKVKGIRCGTCSEPTSATLTRKHNNANMIAFGARIVGLETAKDIVDAFLETDFDGGERHQVRIDKISAIESC